MQSSGKMPQLCIYMTTAYVMFAAQDVHLNLRCLGFALPIAARQTHLMEAWATCMTALSLALFSPVRSNQMRDETSASGYTDESVEITAVVSQEDDCGLLAFIFAELIVRRFGWRILASSGRDFQVLEGTN